MSAEITSLSAVRAEKENDATLICPAECLEEAARQIRAGNHSCQKLIVITLDEGEDGNSYNHGFFQSGMKQSEIIALLEVTKAAMISDMAGE